MRKLRVIRSMLSLSFKSNFYSTGKSKTNHFVYNEVLLQATKVIGQVRCFFNWRILMLKDAIVFMKYVEQYGVGYVYNTLCSFSSLN